MTRSATLFAISRNKRVWMRRDSGPTAYHALRLTRPASTSSSRPHSYNTDGDRPSAPEEELACDAFARQFLLEGVRGYAAQTGQSAEDVLAKRAAGIALGAYALYEFTPEVGRAGSDNYPPAADRLGALFPEVSLPFNHWFWDFAASSNVKNRRIGLPLM
jgi:Peptidase U49